MKNGQYSMELPNEIVINSILDSYENKRAYLFKSKGIEKEHFHICLKVNNDSYILLFLVTSQVDKRLQYYKIRNDERFSDTVVVFDNTLITCLSKQSCVDCNQPKYLTRDELFAEISGEVKFIDTDI
ncbi:MAG: hypothetical protein KAI79_12720, partial [Bacteroidales bacterium]|nr:hypothetical protein [Bacteroidales bacterium]